MLPPTYALPVHGWTTSKEQSVEPHKSFKMSWKVCSRYESGNHRLNHKFNHVTNSREHKGTDSLSLVKYFRSENERKKICASKTVNTTKSNSGRTFVDVDRPVTGFHMTWRNNDPKIERKYFHPCTAEWMGQYEQFFSAYRNTKWKAQNWLHFPSTDLLQHSVSIHINLCLELPEFSTLDLFCQHGYNHRRWGNRASMNWAGKIIHVYVSFAERSWELQGNWTLGNRKIQNAIDFGSFFVLPHTPSLKQIMDEEDWKRTGPIRGLEFSIT